MHKSTSSSDDVKRHIIHSVAAYIECISGIKKYENSDLWFRGHSKPSYELLPSLLRTPLRFHDHNENIIDPDPGDIIQTNQATYNGYSSERLLNAFKTAYGKQRGKTHPPQNDWEWLCLMQHYRIPTRVLDWSTNALVALYFALKDASPCRLDSNLKSHQKPPCIDTEHDFKGAIIYATDPKKINSSCVSTKSGKPYDQVLDLSERPDLISQAVFPHQHDSSAFCFPTCITSKKFDFRILAQQGVFMLFGKYRAALDYYPPLKPLLHKIFIPESSRWEMFADLNAIGISENVLFPDRDPLAVIALNSLDKHTGAIIDTEELYVKGVLGQFNKSHSR
jgi:hypothetical protein